MAALSHRKPKCRATCRDSGHAQGYNTRDTVLYQIKLVTSCYSLGKAVAKDNGDVMMRYVVSSV
jgi:hypothetical protein